MDNNPNSNSTPHPQEPLSPTPPVTPQPSVQPTAVNPPAPTPALPPSAPVTAPSVITPDNNAPQQPVAVGSFGPQQPAGISTAQPVAGGGLPGNSRKKPAKAVLIAVAAVTVIGLGSAAAYFGAVVPNQPANKLRTALINTIKEKQGTVKGTVTADATDNSFSLKMDIDSKYNNDKKAADATLGVTASGVNLTFNTKLVDDSVYLRVSDLSTIATLASGYSPELGSLVNSVSGTVSNKWIEIDSTLIKEAGGSCLLDGSWNLTDKDIDLLTSQYSKNEFVTIKDTADDNAAGKAATKYDLEIDNEKADKYADSLDELSIIKSLEDCAAGETLKDDAKSISKGTTNLTLWVDNASKRISQVNYHTTSAQEAKDDVKGDIKLTFDYSPVSIEKPADAVPLVDVMAQLQTQLGGTGIDLTNLLGANGIQ